MKSSRRGFDCDKQAKYDFTASTFNYWNCNTGVTFWEVDKTGHLVPFGDENASKTSKADVVIIYDDKIVYIVELKERDCTSTRYASEGAFINPEKLEFMKKQQAKGYVPLWGELYTDGIIRLWNLNTMDLDSLTCTTKAIKRYDIYEGERIMQKRYLLPTAAAVEYERINDEQRYS